MIEDARDEVFAELEAAWSEQRDAAAVDRLAAEHPELSEELYGFFSDLVLGEGEGEGGTLGEGAAGWNAREWLEREGHEIGRQAAEAARAGAL